MLKCILLLSGAVYAYAAVSLFAYEAKPTEFADREGCYLSSLNKVLPYDEPYNPSNESCVQYRCSHSNTVSLFSCGAVAIQPGCRSVSDLTKEYPECCPRQKCD